jgi:hypothetical protein
MLVLALRLVHPCCAEGVANLRIKLTLFSPRPPLRCPVPIGWDPARGFQAAALHELHC